MGTLKVIQNINSSEDYLFNALNYALYGHTIYSDGIYVTKGNAYKEMMYVKNYFHKTSGNQLVHFIITFNENIYNEKFAMKLADSIARYYSHRYQVVYGLHEKNMYDNKGRIKSYYHVHIIINSVSYIDGKMFAENKGDINQFKEYICKVTKDNNIEIIY